MAPKNRKKENKPLPSRWRWKNGAYRYRVPPGLESQWDGKKEFTLGATVAEAYRVWSERMEGHKDARTVGDVLDQYALQVVPSKAASTQAGNLASITRLRPVFGGMPIANDQRLATIEPHHVYQYMDVLSRNRGPATVNQDVALLMHMFSMAVKWGLIKQNPIKGQVRKLPVPRRDRYVEDWEYEAALSVASPMLVAYLVLKMLTGLRRGDLLRIQEKDISAEGLYVRAHKTAKTSGIATTYEMTDALSAAINAARTAKKVHISQYLFHTQSGECFVKADGTASAFNSLWRRFQNRCLRETNMTEKFQEKDLRKKLASDVTLEEAQSLLMHSDSALTKRVYRLRGERVMPLK